MEQPNQQPFQQEQSSTPLIKKVLANPKLPLIAVAVAIILTVGGVLLLQESRKGEQVPNEEVQYQKVPPMLVWYQPTELLPHIVAKSRVSSDSNFRGLDVDYWCAIDEAVLDGGFHIRQRPVKVNPNADLLKGQLEYIEDQKKYDEVDVFESVKVGLFDGYYVRLRHKGVQDAQVVMWESKDTYVKISADSWCRTDIGKELAKEELMKIAESMAQNPLEIFDPKYLPKKVRRNSLAWSEPKPIVSEDLEKLQLIVDVSSQKKEVVLEYTCEHNNDDFVVIQSSIDEEDKDLGLAQLVEKTTGERMRRNLETAERIKVNGMPALFVENEVLTPIQVLWWKDNFFLFTTQSMKEDCSTTKEELVKTAESVIPIPSAYFFIQKPPQINETSLEHLPILQKIQIERQGPSINPESWPLYTSFSGGYRYQINVHPDFIQPYGPTAGWSLLDKSVNPIPIAGFSVNIKPLQPPSDSSTWSKSAQDLYRSEVEFYENIYTLLNSKPVGEIYDKTSGKTYIKIKEIEVEECKAQQYLVKFDEEEFERLKREKQLYGDLIRRYREGRNIFIVCVSKEFFLSSQFQADNEDLFNKYTSSFDASLSTLRIFKD